MTMDRVHANLFYLEIDYTAENEAVNPSLVWFDNKFLILPENAQEFWSKEGFKNVEKNQAFSEF